MIEATGITSKMQYNRVKAGWKIDKQVFVVQFQNALWDKNEIRMFKITSGSDEFAIIFTEDYVEHIRKRIQSPDVLQTVGKRKYAIHFSIEGLRASRPQMTIS